MNNEDEIDYIVEIKSEENKHEGIKKINRFKEYYDYKIILITYKDLLKIYQDEMPISLNKARTIWKEEYDTSLNHNVSGENNPMFGVHHNESTKLLISQKGKERFKNKKDREEAIKYALESNISNNYSAQKQPRVKRESRICAYEKCNNEFIVTVNSKRKYCSQLCTSRVAAPLGAKAEIEKSRRKLDRVKEYIIHWSMNNQEIISETPYNRIKTNLHELFDNIHTLFDIKDMRIISKAVFGEDRGRKELLTYLKEIN